MQIAFCEWRPGKRDIPSSEEFQKCQQSCQFWYELQCFNIVRYNFNLYSQLQVELLFRLFVIFIWIKKWSTSGIPHCDKSETNDFTFKMMSKRLWITEQFVRAWGEKCFFYRSCFNERYQLKFQLNLGNCLICRK